MKVPENKMGIAEIGTGNDNNPFTIINSAARNYMYPNHLAQTPVFKGVTNKRIFTGVEQIYGEGTIKVEVPKRCRVTHIINKFKSSGLKNTAAVKKSPTTSMVYMDWDMYTDSNIKLWEMVDLDRYSQKHPDFGFEFEFVNGSIQVDDMLDEGTVIAKSPNWHPETGDYNVGFQINACNLSIVGITEDGYVVSDEFINSMSTTIMGSRRVGCGKYKYFLPLFGDERNPKIVPDIGEYVDETGLLAATRDYDEVLAPIDMLPRNLKRVDPNYDDPIYIPPNSKVIDIDVLKGNDDDIMMESSCRQLRRYYNSLVEYNESILAVEAEANKNRISLGPRLNNAATTARLWLNKYSVRNPRSWRGNPLPPWEIEVRYSKEQKLTIGSKITGQHGNKGVICAIWPVKNMPIDIYGTRAHIIMDGDSMAKRMNMGAPCEPMITAYLDQAKRVCSKYLDEGNFDAAWNYYYEITSRASQSHGELMNTLTTDEQRKHQLETFLRPGIHRELYLPPSDNNVGMYGIDKLKEFDKLDYGPVKYIDEAGNKHITVERVIISSIYMLALEKLGHDWSAVSSAKRQHFGLLAKPSTSGRYSIPCSEKPRKFWGEAEVKLLIYACGPEIAGKIINRPSDPIATNALIKSILTSDKPMAIEQAIDYTKVKPNGNRATKFMENIHFCDGQEFVRDPL